MRIFFALLLTMVFTFPPIQARQLPLLDDVSGKQDRGLERTRPWYGAWIGDGQSKDTWAAPYFRKQFTVTKPVRHAEVFIAVGGLYRLSLNGKRVGDHFLDPAFSRYDRRCEYVAFDVTSQLQDGTNALGVVLGNGWYNHQALAVWDFEKAPWRNRPTFCLDLQILYQDGTSEMISTDLSWKTSFGAWVYNNIYTGEHYDFNLEQKGWDAADFDDSRWHGVQYRQSPASKIIRQNMEPIRLVERINAVRCQKINDTTYVYDFGKNMAGITHTSIKGLQGTVVRIQHGERLQADGTLDMHNIDVYYRGNKQREPFQTHILTLSGGDDAFAPEFSYQGFRYVQVTTSTPITLTADNVVAYFVHSDVSKVGMVESGSELLNKIFAATNQSYISNLMGYPTDCPQREKNGWTGDGHLAVETGLYSYNAKRVYEKWLADFRDEQQPNGVLPDIVPTDGWGYGTANGLDWTSSVALIPWNLYLFYGDLSPLKQNYQAIKRYVDYVDRNCPSHLSSWGRGDWVPVKTRSNLEFTSSIYFYTDAVILSKTAKLLGKTADATYYGQLADAIRKALNDRYLDKEKAIYAGGSQTEMSMALYWGIAPDDMKARLAENLAADVRSNGYHLDVGVLGCKAILNALSENGKMDEAYRLAVQDTYPSWGWWIVNGATTLHENWDINAARDISDNHIMFGEIGAWLYKGLGGIYPDESNPGFKHIVLRPHPIKELKYFTAKHTSPYGEIISSWKIKGSKVAYYVKVPKGCTATLYYSTKTGEKIRELSEGEWNM